MCAPIQLVSPITFFLLICLYLRGLSEVMCLCAMVIDFTSLDDFSIGFWNYSSQCDIFFQFIIYACIMCIAHFSPQTQEVLFWLNNMFLSVRGTSLYNSLTVCASPTAMFRAIIVRESAYRRERNSLRNILSNLDLTIQLSISRRHC
jgi:hypothetical protein